MYVCTYMCVHMCAHVYGWCTCVWVVHMCMDGAHVYGWSCVHMCMGGHVCTCVWVVMCVNQSVLTADSVNMSEEDVDFMMKFVENKVELFFKFSHQKLLPEQIFRGEMCVVWCGA